MNTIETLNGVFTQKDQGIESILLVKGPGYSFKVEELYQNFSLQIRKGALITK